MNNSITFYIVKIKEYAISLIIFMFFILLLIFSNDAQLSVKNALELFLYNIFPSIFPFMVLTNIILQMPILDIINKVFSSICNKIFHLPGISAIAIFLGMLSGYPLGAKICNDLYEQKNISKEQAELLLAFTNNSGPLFILAYIGLNLYYDIRTGILLLITHIVSALIVGIILCRLSSNKSTNNINNSNIHKNIIQKANKAKQSRNKSFSNIFVYSIQNSVMSILSIGGFIIIFAVLISLLESIHFFELIAIPINYIFNIFNISNTITLPIFKGILEMTTGLYSIANTNCSYILKTCISSFILGCGGLSIYMQLCSVIISNNLSTKKYILGKILQGIISCILTYILIAYTPFFNLDIYTSYIKPSIQANVLWQNYQIDIFLNLILLAFTFISLFKMYQIKKEKIKE